MKQKTKILLILILTAALINTSVRYMLVEFPNVQESVHLANTQKHASDVRRAAHISVPVYHTQGIVCKSIIYSAITKFIFENTKILIYIWQFPRANIFVTVRTIALMWEYSENRTNVGTIFPTNRTYIIVQSWSGGMVYGL